MNWCLVDICDQNIDQSRDGEGWGARVNGTNQKSVFLVLLKVKRGRKCDGSCCGVQRKYNEKAAVIAEISNIIYIIIQLQFVLHRI